MLAIALLQGERAAIRMADRNFSIFSADAEFTPAVRHVWRTNIQVSNISAPPRAAKLVIKIFLGATVSVGKVGGCLTTSREKPCSVRGIDNTSLRYFV